MGSPAFEAALDNYTQSVTHPGNSAQLLQNGDEAYPIMLELINSAKTRISMGTYIIEKDKTTDIFFQALKNAVQRGVEVRFLADAMGFGRGMVADLKELEPSGIKARVFNPLFFSWTIIRGNNRDHRKILVVDGQYAVLGGINLSDKQLGNGITGWRDTSLLVAGPAAADAEQIFAQSWDEAGSGFVGHNLPLTVLNPIKNALEKPFARPDFSPPPYTPPDEPPLLHQSGEFKGYHTQNASVRVVASAPDSRNSTTYDLAILGVLGAREQIDIACAYFVPPLSLRRALLSAAERGVRIRLLLPEVTDVTLVREIGMQYYGELLRAGITIYEWPYPVLHAKTMAVDSRWMVVGSANMDSRSYFLNYEANLVVTDEALAQEAHAQFERDLAQAHELTLEKWQERGGKQRALEIVLTPIAGQY